MKNIQAIDCNAYEAFGFSVENKPGEVTHYYLRGINHTSGGGVYRRTFNPNPSEPVLVTPEGITVNGGVYGGLMDNGEIVMFYPVNNSDGTRDIYIIKGDTDNNFGIPVLFDWTGIVKLKGGFFYGPLITGDSPGEYYHMLYQSNLTPARYRVSCVKTTDYWNTYTESVVYDGTIPISETAGVNLGGGKFLALGRLNNAGNFVVFESINSGTTWVRRPTTSNLFWFSGGLPEIPWILAHDGVFDIAFQCRDASMIMISKGNTVVANFGNATPLYKSPEIYSYHRGTGGNPSLGYVSQIKLSSGDYFIIYSKQYNNTKANLQWTYDDLITDPGCIPEAPQIVVTAATATSFNINITNYNDTTWQNVRYFLQDISVHEDFSDFVTCKYRTPSGFPAVKMQNIWMNGWYDNYTGLVTGTTYYLRIKACNNKGCSGYTTVIKTL